MRARALAVAVVWSVGFAPSPTWGKCAAPMAVIVPPDGSPLPPKPTLYVFVPGRWGRRPPETPPLTIVDGAGATVSFRVTRAGEVPAFSAYRVDVEARAGSRITVKLKYKAYGEVTLIRSYSVTAAWERPARGATAVTKVEREKRDWTCSFQSSRNLTPSRFAPAYRIEWALTPADWRGGVRGQVVLPYSKGEFWRRDQSQVPQVALLELGHLDCIGFTFEWKGKPIYVGLAALYPDGSEDPPVVEPVRVSPP